MRITKYVGLLAIIPLLAISLTVGFGGDAAAVNTGTQSDGSGDHRHNLDTGQSIEEYLQSMADKAGTVEAKTALADPYFDLIDVQSASANSDNLYKAIFDVWAGDRNVENVNLLVKSDMESFTTLAGSFDAGDHSITVVKIRARDSSSITGEIVGWDANPGSQNHLKEAISAKSVDFSLPEAKSTDGSYFEVFDMVALDDGLYKLTLQMYAGPQGISTGKSLHITSDSADLFMPIPRIDANSSDWLSAIIEADDLSTIMIE